MKTAAKFFLLPILFLLVSQADARVEWNEPEVVPEKLVRQNRRVLRFSGVTKPGTLVRIRKNRLKLYLDSGKTRLARIPQKNRIQFPVAADQDGIFTFDLYLPTIAVEIPVEMKQGKRWQPYTLNFRVPNAGAANDFQAMEESFQAQDERMESSAPRQNYYSRKKDQGLVIKDRLGGTDSYGSSPIRAWAGLGLSYFNTSVDIPAASGSTSGSTLVIPSWRLGGLWDYTDKIRFVGTLRSSSGSTDDIGDANTQGRDFSWLEVELGGVYFFDRLVSRWGRFGLDAGFQLQSVPYFRNRENAAGFLNETTYFDNSLYNLHLGVHFESVDERLWNYEAYFRYLVMLSAGETFAVDSLPINIQLGGGMTRNLTQTLSLGVFAHLNYFSMKTSFSSVNATLQNDMSLMLLTVDARLISHF